jgi:uncharacterized membrane protein YccF (DUF307 family)
MNDLSTGNSGRPVIATTVETRRPGCLIQILWFIFIGSWFGAIWVMVAWVLLASIIGAPLGAAMLNQVPQVMALRGRRAVEVRGGRVYEQRQAGFVWRALWFVLVGWWASAIWLSLAYVACISIILMPVGFWMFDATPWIVSLKR